MIVTILYFLPVVKIMKILNEDLAYVDVQKLPRRNHQEYKM